MSWLVIVIVIGVIGVIICQQVAGQQVQGKRLVLLPAVLTVIGFIDLHNTKHLNSADYVFLAAGAAGALAIGLAFGVITRLSSRDGVLWAQLPPRGLWLWVALVAWRGLIMVVAARTGAHVAASTTPLLFTLGLNRLGQAAVIVPRALLSGIPFAPEKDGRTFLAGAFDGAGRARPPRY